MNTSNRRSRRLAITSGDPAGIGPEITAAAALTFLNSGDRAAGYELHIYGDARLFPKDLTQHPKVRFHDFPCVKVPEPGQAETANAPYVIGLIETAVRHIMAGKAEALITAPIAKSVLYAHGFSYPGHTEFLGYLAGQVPTHMMLASADLRVMPVTLHQSLKSAIADLDQATIIQAAQAAHLALKNWFGITRPRLVVCGLNPHAGENGTLGLEDEEIVRPAVETLQAQGMDIRGPLPADTLFHPAARATYDCALGLYHDQALIPIKALAFDQAVNLTLGLPFIRTSPDHGTAFDIAGKALARPQSMLAAIEMAAHLGA